MPLCNKSSDTDDSVAPGSAHSRPRRWRQPGQALQQSSMIISKPVVAHPGTACTDHGPQTSSTGLIELQTALVAKAHIGDIRHALLARSAEPLPLRSEIVEKKACLKRPSTHATGLLIAHPATLTGENSSKACPSGSATARPQPPRLAIARTADSVQASTGDLAAARPQNAHPAHARREDWPRSPPTDPAAARPRSICRATARRVGHLRPASGNAAPSSQPVHPASAESVSFSSCLSQVSQPASASQQQTLHRPTGGESSARQGRRQKLSISSLFKKAGWSEAQTAPPVTVSGPARSTRGQSAASSSESTQDYSVAPTGHQFSPPPVWGDVILPGHNTSGCRGARSPESKIGIGIEVEFLLKALQPENRRSRFNEFAEVIATQHDLLVGGHHPRMQNDVLISGLRTRFDKWVLLTDTSMSTHREPCEFFAC